MVLLLPFSCSPIPLSIHSLTPYPVVASATKNFQAQETIQSTFLAPSIKKYIVNLVRKTREHEDVHLGASPRGTLGLIRACQAWAAINGRDHVLPDDAKALAVPVLGHRIRLIPGAHLQNLDAQNILMKILDNLPPPGGPFFDNG